MKRGISLCTLLSSAILACGICAGLIPGSTAHAAPIARPAYVLGPSAVVSGQVASNSYLLFTCQVGLIPGVSCYDPYQMRHAYGTDALIDAGWDGTGKTIVIVDAFQSPNIGLELSTFDNWYGLPAPQFTQIAPYGLTPFDQTSNDQLSWAEEISLDVEWAHAIAPGARIVLVLAKSDQDADIYAATKYAVDNHLGDVISQSFGENEACIDPSLLALQHQMFAEATRKGMTIFASSGDFGAGQLTCDGSRLVQAVSTPAIDPLVTAVGGTELHAADYTSATPGAYESESVWNEPDFGAGGGGFSLLYSEPSYQEGTIHGGKQRGVPDVTYSAAVNHGVLTFLDIPGIPSGFYLFGGTSAGSPQWSAITAIADQKNGADLGFINKALYHIGHAPPHYAQSFHDVTVGNNSWGGVPGFNAAPGWDPASGIGSPKVPGLVDLLIQLVSPGDGNSAIAQSATKTNKPGHGHMKPH
jgi:subtilase family serine protease